MTPLGDGSIGHILATTDSNVTDFYGFEVKIDQDQADESHLRSEIYSRIYGMWILHHRRTRSNEPREDNADK
jgi:hypothetical protein